MTRLMVIGESLVDILHSPGRPDQPVAGGSAANCSVALGRLGHPVTLVTDIGSDEYGRLLVGHLEKSGVTLGAGSVREGRSSSAVATLDSSGAASYTFDVSWAPPAVGVASGTRVVHVSSVAAVQPWATGSVLPTLREARAVGAMVSFDPNIRPSLVTDPLDVLHAVEETVRYCDLVKLSDEDAAWLARVAGKEPDVLVREWVTGNRLVVLTRGSSSAVAMTTEATVCVPVPKAQVVDTVGAGDSFIAGLLDEFLAPRSRANSEPAWSGRDIASLLRRGALVASVTVSRAGANPPWSHEIGSMDPPSQGTENAASLGA